MNTKTPPKGGFKIQKWHLIILGVIVVGLALWHTLNVTLDGMTVKPAKIYEEAFDSRLAAANNLTGGGSQGTGNFNVWLHFNCPTNDIKIKNQSQYEKKPMADEATRYFRGILPDDKVLQGQSIDMDLFYLSQSELTSVKNQWILHDRVTGDYYYRKWGY